jgi:molybdenum cofactor biosynthesis enzyme MoaA
MTDRRNNKKHRSPSRGALVAAVVADEAGNIFDLEGYAAVGMSGPSFSHLTVGETISIPHGSELMYLPDRAPVAFNLDTGKVEVVSENPYAPGEALFPVSAFNSPGYLITSQPAYEERNGAANLPLFSYGAVGWYGDGFRSAVMRIDRERRQDLRLMPPEKVEQGVARLRKKMPGNRLRKHLEKCALTYGCPAAKNFFIGRCEAPLPASPQCNARCLGCLSLQSAGKVSHCQDRITFMPTPDEIAEIALEHLSRVKDGVVSFGQGCEGDPLLAAEVIEPAIRKIRERTSSGTINMNTNGSLPDVLERLFDAGLDSIRVSMNSVRKECYIAYFRPRGYRFEDVLASISLGISRGRHVAVNYLNMAGITDAPEEVEAILSFLHKHPIHLIQWRNMNFDPIRYRQAMDRADTHGSPVGMRRLVARIEERFPRLRHGYFNPHVKKTEPEK